jgi:NAD(P)-dependent dehydrogenase (short-subunit alcohol dehydrogenase family)
MSDLSIFDLTGKKALVTGAAGGIGKACAIGMARAGADLAIIDLKLDMGEETADEIRALGRDSMFIRCDVSSLQEVDAMVDAVVKRFGRLDIAFNNAGMTYAGAEVIDDEAVECWNSTIATLLTSVFYCCRAEARYMIPQNYGKIINTASMGATIIANVPGLGMGHIAYTAAKAGVKHLTKGLAANFAERYNITVNSISPGYVVTPMTKFIQDTPAMLEQENLTTPMHRQGQPEEMVGGVLYLASDASSFTTGHDLIMDGGYTIW